MSFLGHKIGKSFPLKLCMMSVHAFPQCKANWQWAKITMRMYSSLCCQINKYKKNSKSGSNFLLLASMSATSDNTHSEYFPFFFCNQFPALSKLTFFLWMCNNEQKKAFWCFFSSLPSITNRLCLIIAATIARFSQLFSSLTHSTGRFYGVLLCSTFFRWLKWLNLWCAIVKGLRTMEGTFCNS